MLPGSPVDAFAKLIQEAKQADAAVKQARADSHVFNAVVQLAIEGVVETNREALREAYETLREIYAAKGGPLNPPAPAPQAEVERHQASPASTSPACSNTPQWEWHPLVGDVPVSPRPGTQGREAGGEGQVETPEPPTRQQLAEARAARFNVDYPVGSPIRCQRNSGEWIDSYVSMPCIASKQLTPRGLTWLPAIRTADGRLVALDSTNCGI